MTERPNVRHLLTVDEIKSRMKAHKILAEARKVERSSLPFWMLMKYTTLSREVDMLEARANECAAILGRGLS